MQRRLRVTLLAALAVLAAVTAAGAGGSTAQRAAKVDRIAIAAPEKANDYGWNQQGVAGARAIAKQVGAKLEVADGIGYDNTDSVLRQLAQGGANLIIAHASGYNTIAPRIAQQFRVPVLITDSPKSIKPGLVGNITFNAAEGSYLAGVLAAKATKTGTLGIVSSAENLNWSNMSGGFVLGARSVNPNIKILYAQIGQAGYADAAGGKRVTNSVLGGGADVVFGLGDGASFGMLQAVETAKAHKAWFIDVVGDKSKIDKKHVLLSSVLWDFRKIYAQAVKDVESGNFGKHDYVLGANNGISLLRTKQISAAAWAAAQKAQKAIVSGKVKIPSTPSSAAVKKLINSK